MSRSRFDEQRDQAIAREYLADHLPCRACGNHTERETLAAYGGQCTACYRAYCSEVPAAPGPWTPERRRAVLQRLRQTFADNAKQHPKAWAHRLKAREEAGEQLSRAQREAWRCALRISLPTGQEAA